MSLDPTVLFHQPAEVYIWAAIAYVAIVLWLGWCFKQLAENPDGFEQERGER